MDGLWGFSFGNSFWGFLQLDVLFVTEHAHVVDKLESLSALALVAKIWLNDLASFDELLNYEVAFVALESGFLHLRDHIVASNNDTLDSDKLFNMGWI